MKEDKIFYDYLKALDKGRQIMRNEPKPVPIWSSRLTEELVFNACREIFHGDDVRGDSQRDQELNGDIIRGYNKRAFENNEY